MIAIDLINILVGKAHPRLTFCLEGRPDLVLRGNEDDPRSSTDRRRHHLSRQLLQVDVANHALSLIKMDVRAPQVSEARQAS